MSAPILITDGVSRVRISPVSKESLMPKTDHQHMDLRGERLAPTLQEWRNASPRELEAMLQQHYVQKTATEIK